MWVQKIVASIIGLASLTIGILRFFIAALNQNIPVRDGVIHIITGVAFLAGAWFLKGKYVRSTNICLGIFYIIFGAIGFNLPHIIVGVVSSAIGLIIKPEKNKN